MNTYRRSRCSQFLPECSIIFCFSCYEPRKDPLGKLVVCVRETASMGRLWVRLSAQVGDRISLVLLHEEAAVLVRERRALRQATPA